MLVIYEKSGSNLKMVWTCDDEREFISRMDEECTDREINTYEDAFDAIDADQPFIKNTDDNDFINEIIEAFKFFIEDLNETVDLYDFSKFDKNYPYELLLEVDNVNGTDGVSLLDLINAHNNKE
ncbi:MAG: hypothetical protein DSY43_01845 [Gammaproteobacteria bacterium]|uniref:Uncharacterized protein n=1 Tax=endosymbiont of Bathymodiolus septemdierum str. Myojin knoll TaxID=1303921 RepID=A0A0N7KBC6_9GAMM|nr:hypothetical protein [Bathymodiolus septemdierum thioautotrophic gill symbiont]RUA06548.1 MAG: hypothetical protein DSY43_01845 [Gammaproteobacteria bacterium]BAS67639.1 hypothetical protein BSEPE_0641 [endosymbiont of Bathymodiolus septemdierum str. Myojin knoll]